MLGRKVLPQCHAMRYHHRACVEMAAVHQDPAEWTSSQPKAKEAWLVCSRSIQVSPVSLVQTWGKASCKPGGAGPGCTQQGTFGQKLGFG